MQIVKDPSDKDIIHLDHFLDNTMPYHVWNEEYCKKIIEPLGINVYKFDTEIKRLSKRQKYCLYIKMYNLKEKYANRSNT